MAGVASERLSAVIVESRPQGGREGRGGAVGIAPAKGSGHFLRRSIQPLGEELLRRRGEGRRFLQPGPRCGGIPPAGDRPTPWARTQSSREAGLRPLPHYTDRGIACSL